jgi:predicted ArsR family transcriptional regulator
VGALAVRTGKERPAGDVRVRRHDGPTRQTVLKLLKTRGSATAGELARELGLTEMAVRRHLAALERDGYASARPVRQPMGRPAYVYELTEEAEQFFPKNYHLLALDLLELLEQEEGRGGAADRMFEARRRMLYRRHAGRMAGKPLSERIGELASIQNDGGYMVEVENASDREVLLHEYNCPIAQVAARYEQACSCELALFRDLLEADVERIECLAKGGSKCTYRISIEK